MVKYEYIAIVSTAFLIVEPGIHGLRSKPLEYIDSPQRGREPFPMRYSYSRVNLCRHLIALWRRYFYFISFTSPDEYSNCFLLGVTILIQGASCCPFFILFPSMYCTILATNETCPPGFPSKRSIFNTCISSNKKSDSNFFGREFSPKIHMR
ncbi:hypothetical protein HOY80DRAFT_271557 [Tuber brumale]|nr:hypothetical protein HOY80DRAFT_271557 [Tuber brumale]